MSKIEWTEKTWNPTIGCNKVSSGCKNCYAEVMAKRLQAMGNKDYKDGFKFKVLDDRLDYPTKIKKPTIFFVNSMSDLFHEKIHLQSLEAIFAVMQDCKRHRFQVLTKRPKRIELLYSPYKFGWTGEGYYGSGDFVDNILLGTSIENKKTKHRLEDLTYYCGWSKFLSLEPLLEDLGELDLTEIDWVIVGGESGSNARPMKKEWVINIYEQCKEQGVAFFFKQWGCFGEDGKRRSKKENGRLLFGKEWNEKPSILEK